MKQVKMEPNYSVKQLAQLAGISVRTLHLYDQIKLLKPAIRTVAGYRQYGEKELLRLQQILFYRELDFPLKEIAAILDDPDFDLIIALDGHRLALEKRKDRLNTLLQTIDNTVFNLKNKQMKNYEDLYQGMPKEEALAWRKDAIAKWGEENVLQTEKALLNMPDAELERLKADQKDIREKLRLLGKADPESEAVQQLIARHYTNIMGFWGLPPTTPFKGERYKGLAELYVTDDRYLSAAGKPDPEFALFMRKAMLYFAEQQGN